MSPGTESSLKTAHADTTRDTADVPDEIATHSRGLERLERCGHTAQALAQSDCRKNESNPLQYKKLRPKRDTQATGLAP